MNRLRSHGRGQVIVLFCLASVVLMGFLGLAVDVGMLWTTRRHMQTAADAAAVAAGAALINGWNIQTAGQNAAALNGFTSSYVTINNGPSSGPYAGNKAYVEAIISQPQTTYFLPVVGYFLGVSGGYSTITIGARAVSGGVSGTDCMYSIDKSASNAFVVSSGTLTTTCGATVDSTSTSGLQISGGSTISGGVGVVASSETNAPTGSYTPNIAPVPDPLAYLDSDEPTVGACTSTTSTGQGYTATNGATIGPGTYCGGIKVQGGNTLSVTAGTYILLGGGLTVSPGNLNISGTGGVTFFNTVWMSGDPTADNVGNSNQYKPIAIQGGSTTTLTAPSSGPLKGILFFQDPNIPSSDYNQKNSISASTGNFTGALYFPNTELDFSGGSTTTAENVILDADIINISGGSNISANFAGVGGSPVKSSALYE